MQTNTLRKRFRHWLLAVFAAGAMLLSVSPVVVLAAPGDGGDPSTPNANKPPATCDPNTQYCSPFYDNERYKTAQSSNRGNKVLEEYVKPAVSALSALAGIAVAGSIIFAGIQYATAGGDSGKVAAAKVRIIQALVVLVAYIFFYSFMRFMLPGSGLL